MSVTLERTAPRLRLNAICPYYTMFPLSFPHDCLGGAQPGEWVLDPFCGRGTTNFAARLRGLPSVGIDSNPVAAAIAAAKLVDVQPEAVVAEAERILATGPAPVEVPGDAFWALAYHPRTLEQICRIREALLTQESSPVRLALRALMLGILHGPRTRHYPSYLSNQMPRTYATKPAPAVRFWNARGMTAPEVDVLAVIRRRAYHTFAQVPPAVPGRILCTDSRQADAIPAVPGGYRWIVTSPPYYGMRSYLPDQWLRLWFLGGDATVRYERPQQVRHGAEAEYVSDLAEVWSNVARQSQPGARLVVRFGAIPSSGREPRALLLKTIAAAACGWRVLEVRSAGTPPRWRRQADQMSPALGQAIEEIDLLAVLER